METSGQLRVTATLLSLFTVQETGSHSQYERNGGVKIRLLLLGIEIRLFNRSARSLVVCRKCCKHQKYKVNNSQNKGPKHVAVVVAIFVYQQ
jgi:hypothetical protein